MKRRRAESFFPTRRIGWLASFLLLAVAGLMECHMARAADNRDLFEARVFQSDDGDRLLYRLLKPMDYDSQEKYPLVVFFHGAGERGDDNHRQLVHGMNEFASDQMMEKYPCFVAAPQCPQGVQWVDTPWTADKHSMPDQPTAPMRLSVELLPVLDKEFSIDPRRIYVMGLSMGGFGAWDAVQRHPNRFAAVVSVCGGGDLARAADIAHIPVWLFHGDSDGVVKTKRSRDMIDALKRAGGSPRYTEYPNTGHDSWSATYSNPEMYDWLFSQRRVK